MNILKNARRIFSSSPGAGSESVLGYKVYQALLNQSGTDAPVATILTNTLGGTPVWNYDAIGNFYCELTGAFSNSKTVIIISKIGTNRVAYTQSYVSTINRIWLETFIVFVSSGSYQTASSNGILVDYPIEIRVYP